MTNDPMQQIAQALSETKKRPSRRSGDRALRAGAVSGVVRADAGIEADGGERLLAREPTVFSDSLQDALIS